MFQGRRDGIRLGRNRGLEVILPSSRSTTQSADLVTDTSDAAGKRHSLSPRLGDTAAAASLPGQRPIIADAVSPWMQLLRRPDYAAITYGLTHTKTYGP